MKHKFMLVMGLMISVMFLMPVNSVKAEIEIAYYDLHDYDTIHGNPLYPCIALVNDDNIYFNEFGNDGINKINLTNGDYDYFNVGTGGMSAIIADETNSDVVYAVSPISSSLMKFQNEYNVMSTYLITDNYVPSVLAQNETHIFIGGSFSHTPYNINASIIIFNKITHHERYILINSSYDADMTFIKYYGNSIYCSFQGYGILWKVNLLTDAINFYPTFNLNNIWNAQGGIDNYLFAVNDDNTAIYKINLENLDDYQLESFDMDAHIYKIFVIRDIINTCFVYAYDYWNGRVIVLDFYLDVVNTYVIPDHEFSMCSYICADSYSFYLLDQNTGRIYYLKTVRAEIEHEKSVMSSWYDIIVQNWLKIALVSVAVIMIAGLLVYSRKKGIVKRHKSMRSKYKKR